MKLLKAIYVTNSFEYLEIKPTDKLITLVNLLYSYK